MIWLFYLQLILGTIPDDVNSTSPRIVSEDNIKFLFEVQKKVSIPFHLVVVLKYFDECVSLSHCCQVDAIRANHSGLMVSLQDICMKPLDTNCATQSILQVLLIFRQRT